MRLTQLEECIKIKLQRGYSPFKVLLSDWISLRIRTVLDLETVEGDNYIEYEYLADLIDGGDRENRLARTGFPYSRLIAWFSDFFNYGNGGDFKNVVLDRRFIEQNNLEGVWRTVFPNLALNESNFKSQCWLIDCHKAGEQSELWSGLKQCLDLPSEQRFCVENYTNPPEYLKILIRAYQNNESNGRDFAEFIEALDKGKDSEGKWYHRLFEAYKRKYGSLAKCDIYLYIDGNRGNLGVGFDRIGEKGEQPILQLNNKNYKPLTDKIPKIYKINDCNDNTEVRFKCKKIELPSDVKGVYYRYISNSSDSRYKWWKRVENNDVIQSRYNQIIVCCENDNEISCGNFEHGGLSYSVQRLEEITIYDNTYSRYFITVNNRPYREVQFELGTYTISLAGQIPQITITQGRSDSLYTEDGEVCVGDCKFKLSNIENGVECKWECNGIEYVGNEFSLTEKEILGANHSCKLRIRCSYGDNNSKIRNNVVWIPSCVSNALLRGDAAPDNWGIKRSTNNEEIIQDRIQNRVRYYITDSEKREEFIYKNAEEMFFWFARGIDNFEQGGIYNTPKEMPLRGDANGLYICIPENINPVFSIGEAEYKPKDGPINGFWRIALDKVLDNLIPNQNDGYVYNPNPNILELKCNGKLIASFGNTPNNAIICQNSQNEWGIYIPNNDNGQYKAVLYTDNTLEDHFLTPIVQHSLRATEGEEFHSLQVMLNNLGKSDEVGEWHLVLMPDRDDYSESLLCGKFLSQECSMRCVRRQSDNYDEKQKHVLLAVIKTVIQIPENHIYAKSRLARYEIPLTRDEANNYWKKMAEEGKVDGIPKIFNRLLNSNYNFLAEPEWFFNVYNKLREGCRGQFEQPRNPPRKRMVENKVNEMLHSKLIDNCDANDCNSNFTRGEGWCSALIAQECIEGRRNDISVRELTRFQDRQNIKSLGISASILANNYTTSCSIVSIEQANIKLQTQNNREIYLAKNRQQDNNLSIRRDNRNVEFNFECFQVKPQTFVETHYGNFKQQQFEISEEGITLNKIVSLCETTKEMAQELRNGLGDVISKVLDKVYNKNQNPQGWCDAAIIALCGMAIAISNTVCRGEMPENWPLSADKDAYKTLLRLVRIFFCRKYEGEDSTMWRCLMREIVANMYLLTYLNVNIQ